VPLSRRAATGLRRHWLIALLLTAGLVLRILVQVAYQPALFYIDSIKYMFGAYAGNDPPGYQLLLKPFLAVANLTAVAAVQHALGLAMAVALYLVLLRRGVPRWLAALATAPVLLDAYQLQLEQLVMPDVLFEALLVAGLVLLLWRARPRLWMVAVAGLLLGTTATMWQPGEILIVPALIYVVIMARGWQHTLRNALVVCLAFAAPILLVSYRDYLALHRFSLAPYAASTIYGRAAAAADCQTLKLPSYEQPLCPPRALAVKLGPDGLDHLAGSPLKHYVPPPFMAGRSVATDFARRVVEQQPLRVAGAIAGDAIKLFAVDRVTSAGDTPIARWQFQTTFAPPTLAPYIVVQGGVLHFYSLNIVGQPLPLGTGGKFSNIHPTVVEPLAKFLRAYQLNGGYTPGPLLLIVLLGGLAGSAFLLRKRRNMTAAERDTARACCYLLGSGVVLLGVADLFEFSWRYQQPALVTLPPAGALGIALLIGYIRGRRRPAPAIGQPVTSAGPADGALIDAGAGTAAGARPEAVAGQPNGASAEPVAGQPNGASSEAVAGQPNGASAEPVAGQPNGASPGTVAGQPNGESAENREPQGKNHASAG
jgi:hypothetical protein